MQRKILSVILAINMTAGLAFTAYASEQEMPQTEAATESGAQTVQEGSPVEEEKQMETETKEKEDTGTSTETAEKTGTTETETEAAGNTVTETEAAENTITETEAAGNTEAETETTAETGVPVETESTTETEASDETETGTEIADGTETETGTADETEVETETGAADKTETETEAADETEAETVTETMDETETETEKITEEKLEVNPVVYSVEFPAIDEFRFILDPYGLRALPEGKSASLEELKPYAGKIYCNKKMMVTNKSSVPVKVRVSIQLTGDISAVESAEDVEADSGNNVLLYIIPSENDLEGSLDNYQKSGTGIVVKKDEPTVLEFMLPEGKYLYKESAEGEAMSFGIADGETGHSAAFEIAGLVNTKADWKTFNEEGKKVGLKISYSYEDASDQPTAYSRSRDAFALLPYDGATVDVEAAE